jgi:hypothetical protein
MAACRRGWSAGAVAARRSADVVVVWLGYKVGYKTLLGAVVSGARQRLAPSRWPRVQQFTRHADEQPAAR